MNFLEILLLGIALAMDCFSVSLAKGIAARRLQTGPALVMALSFGIFQAGMPLIGFFAGTFFAGLINRIAPWLALVLLGYIGGKMIWDYFHPNEESTSESSIVHRPSSIKEILVLSVATSIDALTTGLIFVPQPQIIWLAVSVIGICSTVLSLTGTLIGVYIGKRFHFPASLIGGIILILIGIKIFVS